MIQNASTESSLDFGHNALAWPKKPRRVDDGILPAPADLRASRAEGAARRRVGSQLRQMAF